MFSYKLRMQPKGNSCATPLDIHLMSSYVLHVTNCPHPPSLFDHVFFSFFFSVVPQLKKGHKLRYFICNLFFFFFFPAVHTSQKNLFLFIQVLPDLPHFSHCKQQKLRWQPGYNETQKDVLADLILSRVVLTCSHPAEIYLLNRFIYYAL